HAGVVRRDPESRLAPRIGGDRRARRHDLHGLARAEPAALLPSRVVRQGHAVPRRLRLAVQDPAEDRRRAGDAAGSRSAVEHLDEHRREDAVRLWRRRRDAGADDAEALPARVRGAYHRGTVSACRRLARAAARRGALTITPVLVAQLILTLF